MDERGLPAEELSDAELERQGTRAHATRNWVFLHGTAEQFRRHTERMLELEQEYLRRHPKRTWQGTVGDTADLAEVDRVTQLRQVVRSFARQMDELLGAEVGAAAGSSGSSASEGPGRAEAALLDRFAGAGDGRMHRLEAHQAARELGVPPVRVAALYKHDPPLLAAAGAHRYLTGAGRSWLDEHRDLLAGA